MKPMTKVVIIGGGPGGYEAALVAAQLHGEVTLVEQRGLGGAAVLTDVVPSKTLISVAEVMTKIRHGEKLGLHLKDDDADSLQANIAVDMRKVNRRILDIATNQSKDILGKLDRAQVRIISGKGRLSDRGESVTVTKPDGNIEVLPADLVLLAVGATPRELPEAKPDGERIFNWTQIYSLQELPKRLIVVGSGVTGAEFANAFNALGAEVVLVSSRHQVLPNQDEDAGRVIQEVFEKRGMEIYSNSRAVAACRVGADQVKVTLEDGREIFGSHCLMAVGSIPNTVDLGLAEAGVETTKSGHIVVDKVSRTSVRSIYAAGDCTGVFALASVAAMQGRIAMWHALGDSVTPLDLRTVSANVFTAPEVATVGVTQEEIDSGKVRALSMTLNLASNPRAKMQGISDGFVKIFCLPTTGIIVGGVVVAPTASELIQVLSVAVRNRLSVDQIAQSFTVYPSLSGSLSEAARQLHLHSPQQLGEVT